MQVRALPISFRVELETRLYDWLLLKRLPVLLAQLLFSVTMCSHPSNHLFQTQPSVSQGRPRRLKLFYRKRQEGRRSVLGRPRRVLLVMLSLCWCPSISPVSVRNLTNRVRVTWPLPFFPPMMSCSGLLPYGIQGQAPRLEGLRALHTVVSSGRHVHSTLSVRVKIPHIHLKVPSDSSMVSSPLSRKR